MQILYAKLTAENLEANFASIRPGFVLWPSFRLSSLRFLPIVTLPTNWYKGSIFNLSISSIVGFVEIGSEIVSEFVFIYGKCQNTTSLAE